MILSNSSGSVKSLLARYALASLFVAGPAPRSLRFPFGANARDLSVMGGKLGPILGILTLDLRAMRRLTFRDDAGAALFFRQFCFFGASDLLGVQ